MSKWQFDLMTDEDARKILDIGKPLTSRDLSADSYGDRVKAHRLLDRRFSDTGTSTPPLNSYRIPPPKERK